MNRIVAINIGLATLALFLLSYFVVQSNALAAQSWRLRDAQDRLSKLRDARNDLIAQQATFDDRQRLLTLAQDAGMVPAGAVVYLVQDHPVAAR